MLISYLHLKLCLAWSGKCTVALFHKGQWQRVTIDTLLPCTQRRPAFAHHSPHSDGQELFACFLEKACAKLRGCYGALSGGRVDEALFMLTAAPTMEMRSPKREELLVEFQAEGSLFACARASGRSSHSHSVDHYSTVDLGRAEDASPPQKVRADHTYVVTEIAGPSTNPKILVCDLSSEDSPEEHIDSKAAVQMELQDFLEAFNRVFVCCTGMFSEEGVLPRRSFTVAATLANSGGATSFPTFQENAMFRVVPVGKMRLAITVSQPEICSSQTRQGHFAQIGVTVLCQKALPQVATDAKSCTRNRRRILRQTPFEGKREMSLVMDLESLAPPWEYRVVPSHFFPGDRGSGLFRVYFSWPGPDDALVVEEILDCSESVFSYVGTLSSGKAHTFSQPSLQVRAPVVPIPVTVTLIQSVERTLCWWKQDDLQSVLHDLFEVFDADADGLLSRFELTSLLKTLLEHKCEVSADSSVQKMLEQRWDHLQLDRITFGELLSLKLCTGLTTKVDIERIVCRLRDEAKSSSTVQADLLTRPASKSFVAVAALNCLGASFQNATTSLAAGCSELPALSDAAVWATSYLISQPEFYVCPAFRGDHNCSFELQVRSTCQELLVEAVEGEEALVRKSSAVLQPRLA